MDLTKETQDIYQEGSRKILEVKNHIKRLLPFWLAGTITALVATGYSSLFLWAEKSSKQIFEWAGLWFILIPPLFFFVSWLLVEKLAPKANGSGIPQLMAAIEQAHQKNNEVIDRLLSIRIVLVKIVSSIIGVIGGGAIGREGPTLQISGSIFYVISKYWKWDDIQNKSAFLMAGAASGLASAFNTPLGGIVYVIEELAKSHLTSFRTGVLHAVIFAGIISQMILGPYLYFGYPKIPNFEYSLIWQYIVIAIISSLIVSMFSQLLKKIVIWRQQLNSFLQKSLFVLLSGFFFSLVVIFISNKAMGTGKELLTGLLFNADNSSLFDVIARFFGTTLTYANGGAGGIFAPTLSLGGSVASYVNNLLSFNLDALAILIGMTAGLTALTHSPLTSFILILEMTDRHRAIFPLMLAALIGHGISKLVSPTSFYEFVYEKILTDLKN